MNFDEAKDYLYNRYKNSFRYVDDVSEDNRITWNIECDNAMTINHYDSDDVIECKLKKIKKYIDDELKTIYEINKKNLIQKLNNL